jgi:hypothetical protein
MAKSSLFTACPERPSLRHHASVGNWVTHREMVHHLSLCWHQVEITVHFIVEKSANSCRA